jgi:hypothetical protein
VLVQVWEVSAQLAGYAASVALLQSLEGTGEAALLGRGQRLRMMTETTLAQLCRQQLMRQAACQSFGM